MSILNNEFAVFIITHGRADKVVTMNTLKNGKYSGPTYLIVDNTDSQIELYRTKFGKENVIVFDKEAIAKTTDQGDNFHNLRTTTHARNACFEIAKDLGIKYFLVLDDDYNSFYFKFNLEGKIISKKILNLDRVFGDMLEYYKSIDAASICMSQAGDFLGGGYNDRGVYNLSLRKCMNSWFCSTDRPFKFLSRLNEDVNTYLALGNRGLLFLTTPYYSVSQNPTQKTKGGMSEAYASSGTYVKSFYSVMYCPSFVYISMIPSSNRRIHHRTRWNNAVPCIISDEYKKK